MVNREHNNEEKESINDWWPWGYILRNPSQFSYDEYTDHTLSEERRDGKGEELEDWPTALICRG